MVGIDTVATTTKRVLIVDDEPVLIGLLREIFARFQHGHHYEITPAYSVGDAFDLLRREQFDLILLDMVVPSLGDPWPWIQGLDLLKRIRRQLGVKAPIFMMTGVWNTEQEAEALIEGASGYLHKPFDRRELDRLVSVALGSGPRAS
jgi:DNA-binding response OmpR family regulator